MIIGSYTYYDNVYYRKRDLYELGVAWDAILITCMALSVINL